MLTLGYVFDENEAVQFADAGADILAIMVGGVTSGGSAGGESALVWMIRCARSIRSSNTFKDPSGYPPRCLFMVDLLMASVPWNTP